MLKKTIWLENVVLFNDCVQKSGGSIHIYNSMTDPDGDVLVCVMYSNINPQQEERYLRERVVKS
jgi:hypothetical protein